MGDGRAGGLHVYSHRLDADILVDSIGSMKATSIYKLRTPYKYDESEVIPMKDQPRRCYSRNQRGSMQDHSIAPKLHYGKKRAKRAIHPDGGQCIDYANARCPSAQEQFTFSNKQNIKAKKLKGLQLSPKNNASRDPSRECSRHIPPCK
jgi:hypothetical protein